MLLAGTVPALRADLLWPPAWFGGLTSRYALPAVENPFGLVALLIAAAIVGIALASDRKFRVLAAVPFVAVLIADSAIGETLNGFNTVYVASAFVAFLYFALPGAARRVEPIRPFLRRQSPDAHEHFPERIWPAAK